MQKTKILLIGLVQARPIATRLFEKREGAIDVRANEIIRPANGTVYVAFGCKMHNSERVFAFEHAAHELSINNVAVQKLVPAFAGEGVQVVEIPGIGQLIEIDDRS